MRTVASLAAVLSLSAGLMAAPANADVGVESTSRGAGRPGDPVELTVGCGFCFPPCVGDPGRLHPPGDRDGVCMLDTGRGPPAAFQVWLTPLERSPARLSSSVFLGRAVRDPASDSAGDHPVPRYLLAFGIPALDPGLYRYLIFCDSCVPGPRGSLVDSRGLAAGRLRILPVAGSAATGGRPGPWIVGLAAATVALLAVALLARCRPGVGLEH